MRASPRVYRWLPMVILVLVTSSLSAEPIRDWLIWGPYAGMAGLEVLSPGVETRIRPAAGDSLTAWGVSFTTKGTWQPYASPTDRVDLDLPETFAGRPEVMDWSRGCAYAHAYIRVPQAQPARILLHANWRAKAWLNGEALAGNDATLGPGWNRLLVKVYYPATWVEAEEGWWFTCDLSTPDGPPIPGLATGLDDPDRDPVELEGRPDAVGRQTSVKLRADRRWAPLFERDEEVRVELLISRPEPNAEAVTRTLLTEVMDLGGAVVHRAETPVTYSGAQAASVPLALGELPVGHYRVVGSLSSNAGVTLYLPPLSFAVIWGPVDTNHDDAPRKLAGCDYWFLNSGEYRERLAWLHRIGLTMNVGTTATWWAAGDLREGELSDEYRPYIDDGLRWAEALGIELVGYLEGGWPVEALQAQPREHWRQQGLSEDYLVVWPWQPLPPFESPDYETIVRRYVRQTVSRYKDRIRVWKSYNEIDIAGKMTPQRYAEIARILYDEVKRADPQAKMIGASLVYLGSDWCKRLFAETDFADHHDVYDIHAHPMRAPSIGGDLGNGPREGLRGIDARIAAGAPDKPIWYGETSPPSAHMERGRVDQADAVVKEAAFAAASPRIENLAWLVPYGAGVSELAVSSPEHYPHPGAVAMNLCNHLIDGRKVLPNMDLPPGVEQLRVTAPEGGETLVLWSEEPMDVVAATAAATARVIETNGLERELAIQEGTVSVRVTSAPVFLCFR